jgi:fatty-acyl-CoA synthase
MDFGAAMIGYQLTINARRHADATAIVFGEQRLSYGQLNERACRVANALAGNGLGRGDRVAGLAMNCGDFVVLLFAAAKIGAIFVPLNFRLAAREVGRILADCGPKILFAGTSLAPIVAELRGSGMLPPAVVFLADDPRSAAGPDHRPAFAEWFGGFSADEPETAVDASDPQLLLHSSGTTGQPKGAVWTHATTLASAHAKIVDFALRPEDATAVFGPLFHVGPLMDLALPLLLRGGKLVIGISTGFDPAELLRTIGSERITVLTIYPTMWRRVLALGDLERFDRSSLRLLLTGGEPIPIPVLREVYARFPMAGFVNTYGSTEGGPITTFLAPEDSRRKIGSVGKPAFSVDIRIADAEGHALATGQVGELLVRSPFVCRGYWRRPEETAASLCQGWWHTGDLASVDAEGFVWIAGRQKDMIISGAENIYPAEVEQVIAALDAVAEVAVCGVPDEAWGEAIAAYVVTRPGIRLDAAQVVEHCRRNLASYKKPRHVIFVDSLPRTTVNKISKDTLRQWFATGKDS